MLKFVKEDYQKYFHNSLGFYVSAFLLHETSYR